MTGGAILYNYFDKKCLFFTAISANQLSQFFRNARRKSAPKSTSGNDTNSSHTNLAKRLKILKDDPEAQKKNLFPLKNGKPGAISKATYKSLVEDTFIMARCPYIRETARSSAIVLDICPYPGKEEHVRDIKIYPVTSIFNQYFEINKG